MSDAVNFKDLSVNDMFVSLNGDVGQKTGETRADIYVHPTLEFSRVVQMHPDIDKVRKIPPEAASKFSEARMYKKFSARAMDMFLMQVREVLPL